MYTDDPAKTAAWPLRASGKEATVLHVSLKGGYFSTLDSTIPGSYIYPANAQAEPRERAMLMAAAALHCPGATLHLSKLARTRPACVLSPGLYPPTTNDKKSQILVGESAAKKRLVMRWVSPRMWPKCSPSRSTNMSCTYRQLN